MRGTVPRRESRRWLRRYRVEILWSLACAAEIAAMIVWPGDMWEVPLLVTLFAGIAWTVSRRLDALRAAEERANERSSLLERQERFIHDASHELRTPLTIARGHLELLQPDGKDGAEVEIALDELKRIDAIITRLLLLAAADQPDFVVPSEIELDEFLEDVFMRWSEIAPRAWQLGPLVAGRLRVDPDRLRAALDALIENAVKYTDAQAAISLRARPLVADSVAIEVEDEGTGIPSAALRQIFERFGRADAARTRSDGGVGLGLAIVDAIAKSHGGRCTVRSSSSGSLFALQLPGFTPAPSRSPVAWPAEQQPA
jgi:signal transduction histidine kinase